MLSYKTDNESVDVLYHPSEYTGPILYAFRGKNLFEKKSCAIRVEGGDWSKQIPLHVAGSTGSVTCKYKGFPFQVRFTCDLLFGKYSLLMFSKIIRSVFTTF